MFTGHRALLDWQAVAMRWMASWRGALERPAVRRVAHNVLWLFADRLVRLGVGFLVGVWVARYLGPERFGTMSYVIAFVTLLATAIPAGTDSIVIRELARDPTEADRIMPAATVIRVAGSAIALVVVVAGALIVHRREPTTLTLLLVFATSLVFRPLDVVDLWFQAETRARPAVWARNVAFLVSSAVKVALLVRGASLLAFIGVEVLSAAITAALLAVAYRADGRRLRLSGARREEVRRLLSAGWPLFLSGLAILVYMRIDLLMLEHLPGGGARQVGLYSVSQRLSEVWYFVPTAITASVFPTLVRTRETDPARYLLRLRHLFAVMTVAALLVAIPTSLFSTELVRRVFGGSYAGAGRVLAIHAWTALFVFWGITGETWFINEGLTHLALLRTTSAAVANVLLNLVLIPRFGGVGAAVATLVSQAWSACVANAVWARTRPLFLLQLRSFSLRGFLE